MRRFSLQNVESILGYTKRDLPKRTGPFYYIGEYYYSSTAACAAANFEANMLIFNDLRLDWSTFGLQFSCILHVLHVDVS